jgi:ParB-like chromosome segregation protein Spo0J
MTPQNWPVDRVRPAPGNPRVHPPEQIEALRASMLEFGFPQPILIDETGEILAGHGRLAAARSIYAEGKRITGLEPATVPVIVVNGLTEAERAAYRVADNRLASLSAFAPDLLADELSDLAGEGVDPALLGFSASDLLRIEEDSARARLAAMAPEDETASDEGPDFEPPATAEAHDARAVRIEIVIPAIDRQIVYDALAKARTQFNVGTTGEALSALLAHQEALA